MIRLRYLRYGLLVLLVLFVGFGFFCLRLRGDTWPVVLTGELAPGTANGRFTALGEASVNSSGVIVFKANLDVGGVQGAGIFEVFGGELFPIALEGQTLPDAPAKSFGALFRDPQINNVGDVVFAANFTSGTSAPPPQGLFLYSGGTLKLLSQGTFRDVRINDAGDIAFMQDSVTGAAGPVYLMTHGTVQAVSTPTFAFALNNHGDIAFIAQDGVALFSNGSVQTVALRGQAVSNSTLTVFADAPISINDDRDIVFLNVAPIGGGRLGLAPNGIVRWRAGVLEKVVMDRDPVPGITGAIFDPTSLNEPRINQSGILFTGRTVVSGRAVDLISEYQNNQLSTIARADQLIEGLGMLNFIGDPNFDTRQGPLVTFVANLGPMAGIFAATNPNFTLLFPQMADGVGSGGGWRTTFVLANRSTIPASATISFYDDNGAPMNVAIGGQQQTQYSLSVPALGVAQFQTDGKSELKGGWAVAQTDQSLSGFSMFSFSDTSGNFVDEVGVPATVPLRSFSVFAQSGADTSTGIALVNPSSAQADVTLILRDSNSNEIARSSISIPPRGHVAKYSREIFAGTPLTDFQGKIEVVSTQSLAAITLRQRAQIFTSLSVIP